MKSENRTIMLSSELPRTVSIRKKGSNRWVVKQRHSGLHEHHQAATYVRINNPGPAADITIEMKWAEFTNMECRGAAYVERDGIWHAVRGDVSPGSTTFSLSVPKGTSHFSGLPWYGLGRGERLLQEASCRSPDCETIEIGETLEGRPITALVVRRRRGSGTRRNFVVVAREHATETAGSFAVERVVDYLLNDRDGRALLGEFDFRLFPVVNPDGAANGRKLPQRAPMEVSDLSYYGDVSDDPTCRAFREYLYGLEPACMVDYHGYLFPVPEVIFYDREDGLVMVDALLRRRSGRQAPTIYAKYQAEAGRGQTTYEHCYRNFKTVFALFELPWAGRSVEDIQQTGLAMFLSVVEAYERRRGRPRKRRAVYSAHC